MNQGNTDQDAPDVAQRLEARGLKCPLPVLLLRRALARLPHGACVELVGDDPASAIDMPVFCHQEGHAIEATWTEGADTHWRIRKNGG